MNITKYNEDWKFWVDRGSFALVWNIPEYARTLTLPHDAMLEKEAYAQSSNGGNTGFRDGEVYNYVKTLKPEIADQKKTMIVKFEGIYMNAMVYVNGQLAARCPYGYTGFYVYLNEYLKYGSENEIRVIVRNNAMTNSRWYSGGGIYQDVYLMTAEEVYIEPDGVQVTTERLFEDSAVVSVKTAMKNRSNYYRELRLETAVIDQTGKVVSEESVPVTLFESQVREMESRIVVVNPMVWSENTPILYQVRSRLYDMNMLLDENIEHFGIRTLFVDARHGFMVNGESVKFRGACIHHDSGIMGAATFYDAEYRRVGIIKKAGFNAIRMAHHPASPVLLRVCDELGMYVMDEAFDMWQRCKSDNDYGIFFDDWWERDVAAMVKKDFNHPSVVMYSIGNEIPEIGTNHGAEMCHEISQKIKRLDNTRYILASINGVFAAGDVIGQIIGELAAQQKSSQEAGGSVNDFMTVMDAQMDKIVVDYRITERLDKACANIDIAGYNYMTARYELDGAIRPNRVIVGSETYPPEIARNWALVEKLSHVIGDFTWTGWDYIGEAGVGVPAYQHGEGGFGAEFPCQLAYCGDIDIIGYRRPASYFREIVFGLRKNPYIAVQNPYRYGEKLIKTPWVISDSVSSWSYPGMEGKPVVVEVYSAGDKVELFINGRSVGIKESGKETGFITRFETVYEPGKLEAVTYENGKEIGHMSLSSVEGGTTLVAKIEKGITGELTYVDIVSQDKNGTVETAKEQRITYTAETDAMIWLGSANPKPVTNYIATETETWHGRALLIVRKTDNKPVRINITTQEQQIEVIV